MWCFIISALGNTKKNKFSFVIPLVCCNFVENYMMGRTLTITNVSIGYGQKVIVEDISATFHPGELTCLLGRNGTGKSTLLRTLAGFQPYLSGEITIGDRFIGDFERKELAKTVGIVLTTQTDLQDISVEELVALGRSPYTGFFGNLSADDRKMVKKAISLVGISELKDRRLKSLSDGERQKAMIAKTLAQETPVILLDEPTAFLDFQSRVELFRLLNTLAHDEKKIILMTTHDVHCALRFCEKVWLLREDSAKKARLSMHSTPLSEETITEFFGKEAPLYLETKQQ